MPHHHRALIAAVIFGVVAGCASGDDGYVAPAMAAAADDSNSKAIEACIGDAGRLANLTRAYYQCTVDEAARMEPSLAPASDIVVAVHASCSSQRIEMTTVAKICDSLYGDVFGSAFDEWEAGAAQTAAGLATKVVIERRVAPAQ